MTRSDKSAKKEWKTGYKVISEWNGKLVSAQLGWAHSITYHRRNINRPTKGNGPLGVFENSIFATEFAGNKKIYSVSM